MTHDVTVATKALVGLGIVAAVIGGFLVSTFYIASVTDCNPCHPHVPFWSLLLLMLGLGLVTVGLFLGHRPHASNPARIAGGSLPAR